MIYGYARCSTNDDKQDINGQVLKLKAAGAEEIIFEYEHGDAKTKKNLQMLLDTAPEQSTIITTEVSRLSRSTQQLCEIISFIKEKRLVSSFLRHLLPEQAACVKSVRSCVHGTTEM